MKDSIPSLVARAHEASQSVLVGKPQVIDRVLVIAIPDADSYDTFEAGLGDARVSQYLSGLQDARVRVHLPKFSVRTATPLNDALQGLGMRRAFSVDEFPGLGTALS